MKILFTSFLTLFLLTLSFGQPQARYTQSAPEIEAVKSWEAAYNTGDWDRLRAAYAEDARIDHNGNTMGPDKAVASLKGTILGTSYYRLQLGHEDLERVITDKGETWVNAWGAWRAVYPGSADTITLPLHLAYRFNSEGKISHEFGFYNSGGITPKRAAARYGSDNLLFIRELTIQEGQEETYLDCWQRWRELMDEQQVPGLYWTSAMREDNIVYHNYAIGSVMDFESIKLSVPKAWQTVSSAMDEAEWAEWQKKMNASRQEYKEYIIRQVPELSYWPSEPNGLDGADIGFFHMYEMEFDLAKYDEHIALVEDIKAMAEEVDTPVPFNYFEYVLGGSASKAVVVEYAKDRADYDRRHAAEEQLFATDKGRALAQRMEALYTSIKEINARAVPEISRPWPGQ